MQWMNKTFWEVAPNSTFLIFNDRIPSGCLFDLLKLLKIKLPFNMLPWLPEYQSTRVPTPLHSLIPCISWSHGSHEEEVCTIQVIPTLSLWDRPWYPSYSMRLDVLQLDIPVILERRLQPRPASLGTTHMVTWIVLANVHEDRRGRRGPTCFKECVVVSSSRIPRIQNQVWWLTS